METKIPAWHILPRNRVSRANIPTFDIMEGNGNPENWEMVAEKVEGEDRARLIVMAVNHYQTCHDCKTKLQAAEEMAKALTKVAGMRFKGKKLECSYVAEEALTAWNKAGKGEA